MKTESYTYGKKPIRADVSRLAESKKDVRRNGFETEIAAIDPKTGRTVVTARIYHPGTVAHCSVWISGSRTAKGETVRSYGRGQGSAGGYGYHKASAALDAALSDAGVILSQCISGVGADAMREAVEAVAVAVAGRRRFIIHEAHA